MTVAKAWPESIPKTATATAMASSKLFDAAVKLKALQRNPILDLSFK
jgi:hypothetical protein